MPVVPRRVLSRNGETSSRASESLPLSASRNRASPYGVPKAAGSGVLLRALRARCHPPSLGHRQREWEAPILTEPAATSGYVVSSQAIMSSEGRRSVATLLLSCRKHSRAPCRQRANSPVQPPDAARTAFDWLRSRLTPAICACDIACE
jgi:hypothetical protein